MMNLKKLFSLLITLIIVYVIFQITFKFVSPGHSVEYIIKTEEVKLNVREVYEKSENNSYYFEISDSKNMINFYIFDDLKERNYVIKEINYFKDDEYTCIYPIFKTKETLTDILCVKDKIIHPYQSIKGQNTNVDKFKESVKEYYDEKKYENDLSNSLRKDGTIIYRNNIIPNHYIALENYKGLSIFNEKDVYKKIELFEKDQYKKEISGYYDNKYIVADYNQEYTFNEFYVVDIKSSKQSKIISNNTISLDGYTMSTMEDKMYVYDKNNKEQYTVNLKNNKINKIGNTSSGIKVYQNNNWETYSSYDAYNKKALFNLYKIVDKKYEEYERVDKLSEYYYLYKKENDLYKVYKKSIQNEEVLTYLFTTTNIENVCYIDNYIYYIDKDKIKFYDGLSSKTVLLNKELEFNNSLKFGVYIP